MELEVWNECVAQAKKKLGITGYGIIKGALLKEAQKAYCASQMRKT